ncbi:MAG: hypothetical protein MK132_10055 [Lentisphaerales bacterium]|nr:hypothetical protein [Lentisphaerales bacterium]
MGITEKNKNLKEKIMREDEYAELHNSQFINGLVKDIKNDASDTFIEMDLKGLPEVK